MHYSGLLDTSLKLSGGSAPMCYWECFSRQDIRECLAGTNERLNCECLANQRARAGLWTGYASGGGGRDELMSGFCHLIGHKGSINVYDWFSFLQQLINLICIESLYS